MSAVELRGPGFVFIGTKLWYASVSNVSARIECRSPETWSPRRSCEILNTVLSRMMCRGSPGTTSVKEIKSKWISVVYLHARNAEGACVQAYFTVNVARSFVKAPHIAVSYISGSKTHTRAAHVWLFMALSCMLTLFLITKLRPDLLVILIILIWSHALAVCLLRDSLAPWVHPGLPVRPAPNDRAFFSLCGPTQFPLI